MNEKRKMKQGRSRSNLPILTGADCELGAFMEGFPEGKLSCDRATDLLLEEFDGVASTSRLYEGSGNYTNATVDAYGYVGTGNVGFNPQDKGRKYLPTTGGCIYEDLSHPEICLPETLSAVDHVAAHQAFLQEVSEKLQSANEKLPVGGKIHVMVNNSDGQGNSYGSHVNFLIPRKTFRNLFSRKLHYLGFLASYQNSSIIFTGQGKVGSENGQPDVDFQIAQRADFFETVTGVQTTYHRPLVNSRDEAHCGSRPSNTHPNSHSVGPVDTMARLHVIFFDNSLCQVTCYLKVGVMQLVLAMIGAEAVNSELILADPVEAVHAWSHDPSLQQYAPLITGESVTALELQFRFLAEVKQQAELGIFEGVVPEFEEIIGQWESVLNDLRDGEFEKLAPRLDWVLKKMIIQRTLDQNTQLNWKSPQIKHLDQVYGSLDPKDGLFLAFLQNGLVETVATDERIAQLRHSPPENTRAWTRAMLLRRGGEGVITGVNWDTIKFREVGPNGWMRNRRLEMADPTTFTKEQTEVVFSNNRSFVEVMDILGATLDTSGSAYSYGEY
jgi:Pup amidohydrolase